VARELCVLTPVLPDRREALTATLAGLPDGEASPLARVPGTHFARWVQAPSLRRRTALGADTACLVFGVEFDHGSAPEYLEDLCRRLPDEADLVWRNCAGYPGSVDRRFVPWLLAHRVEPGFSIVAFPSATVAEVREALALRERVATFALAAQGMPPEGVRQAWREHVSPS
jgi:hypothetical protein